MCIPGIDRLLGLLLSGNPSYNFIIWPVDDPLLPDIAQETIDLILRNIWDGRLEESAVIAHLIESQRIFKAAQDSEEDREGNKLILDSKGARF